ncbi:uncharacterized protein DSM5745_02724 [Aspergillus mulundensis]|uniref:Retrotransposon Copia-like N-terminal domain-containing protein n=1 Tax=Aspergillus mulundensis TaxID=1810919 RepID=A0A3D8SII0_9EURO|nr:hypothetical protein DSM5745_02724 [Aspergillus mulundensis]RDW86082.1 hypothetical protein DSM5745_02724 [Aspergillus mulundensis]
MAPNTRSTPRDAGEGSTGGGSATPADGGTEALGSGSGTTGSSQSGATGRSRPAPTVANQAYYNGRLINETPPTSMAPIREALIGREDYTMWADYAIRQLRVFRMSQLVDKSVPRPRIGDPEYEVWEDHSIVAANWLVGQLSKELFRRVSQSPYPSEFADDAWTAIKRVVMGNGVPQISKAALALFDMRAAQFGKISEFIGAYLDAWDVGNQLGVAPTPGVAAIFILREIKAEMTAWVVVKESTITEANLKSCTEDHFRRLCDDARAQAESNEEMQKIPLAASANKLNRGPDIPALALKGPGEGVSDKDHANEMRGIKPQTDANGYCAYCGCGRHMARGCFYLRPDLRPEGWTPRHGIWALKDESKDQSELPAPMSGMALRSSDWSDCSSEEGLPVTRYESGY